jgi:dienelactone hydrolase
MLGILSLPEVPRADAPTLLLLNAGLLHRVGPNRLHVDLARRLATSGFSSFRFDMSGIGDSDHGGSDLLYIERSVSDVIEAMDLVQRLVNIDQFVTAGLCTGAFNSFRAALADERIKGCALLDGYSYPTIRSQLRYQRTRILDARRWSGFLRRKLANRHREQAAQRNLVVFENEVVPKERFEDELATLIDRDVRMLFVYTRFGPLSYSYPDQLFDAFPGIDLRRTASVRYYPDADHTFTLPGNRSRLVEDITSWMTENFGPSPVGHASRNEGER